MCPIKYISFASLTAFLLLLLSCGDKSADKQEDKDVLVSVGDSVLTLREVVSLIPVGLSEEDSTTLFHKIVDDWVRDLVLTDYAENNIPDIDKIDRMVENYRNNLIVERYIQSMTDASSVNVSESRIKAYYEEHHAELILDQPLVKGAYLKVAESDPNIDNLRLWMSNFNEESIDKIEKIGLRQALQYSYFKDEWNEWGSIVDRIPYRFFDADAFVRSTKNFETSDAGSVYLLHISDFVASGTEMPYEYARLKIMEILRNSDIVAFRKKLVSDIYKDRIKAGVLKIGMYDPIKGDMKSKSNN